MVMPLETPHRLYHLESLQITQILDSSQKIILSYSSNIPKTLSLENVEARKKRNYQSCGSNETTLNQSNRSGALKNNHPEVNQGWPKEKGVILKVVLRRGNKIYMNIFPKIKLGSKLMDLWKTSVAPDILQSVIWC